MNGTPLTCSFCPGDRLAVVVIKGGDLETHPYCADCFAEAEQDIDPRYDQVAYVVLARPVSGAAKKQEVA